MLAASIVEKIRPGPSRRPATKKSCVVRTRRPIHRPRAICAAEYTTSSARYAISARRERRLGVTGADVAACQRPATNLSGRGMAIERGDRYPMPRDV